jgi:hypothetical protein
MPLSWPIDLKLMAFGTHLFSIVPPMGLVISRVSPAVSRRASHRSGRARLRHPARLIAVSRALCCPWAFRGPWIEVQSPRTVARPRFRNQAPPSLHRVRAARVPRLLRYYGALRFPTARAVALRCLRAAVTTPCACVRRSLQVRRRLEARGFRVWQPRPRPVVREMETMGRPKFLGNPRVSMPCSLTPAGLQRTRPLRCASTAPARITTKAPRER